MIRPTHINRKQAGLSLIEIVIYIGIAVVLLSLIVTLYLSMTKALLKQQVIAEVENQGIETMNLITQAVRNSTNINSPATGTSATSLSLATASTSTNPTVFSFASSMHWITLGTSTATALTGSQIVVSNVSFTNLSWAGTSGSVKIQFTLSYATTSNKYTTAYSKVFYGSATIRKIAQ